MATNPTKNWFDQGGAAYARFRPENPPELAKLFASIAPTTQLAVDVGCGTGQLATQLGDLFERTIGIDPSADQLKNATPHSRVEYRCGPAEKLPADNGSASLIVAAQAAHWFDLPRFYAEVRRVAAPGAVVALVSYGVLKLDGEPLDGELDARFQQFYWEEVGEFWPPERRLVDSGYAGMDFPFDEHASPQLQIRKDWTLAALLGYISTWSAVRHARDAGAEPVLQRFALEFTELWGTPTVQREVRWPISMRLGTVATAR
ncbi:MAG: class I SAM-dependent methyltransferase [Steroidobacteraceae bacterium]